MKQHTCKRPMLQLYLGSRSACIQEEPAQTSLRRLCLGLLRLRCVRCCCLLRWLISLDLELAPLDACPVLPGQVPERSDSLLLADPCGELVAHRDVEGPLLCNSIIQVI